MQINSIGYNFRHGNEFNIIRPSGLDEYLFLIIRSPALFCINENTVKLSENSMIFISKNTPHSFYADSSQFINDWISVNFNEHEFSVISENICFNTFFTSSDVSLCSQIIRYMQSESISQNPTKQDTLQSFFNIILNMLRNNSNQEISNKKYYSDLKKVRDTIYAYPCRKYTINELSEAACLSSSYFHRLYKLYFGVSPISDVINSRIEYAKKLLIFTNYTISKIAETLGYSTDMQFIKQFRELTKTTPHKYRSDTNNSR